MAETCPICNRPSAEGRVKPFCSVRCAQVDLGRWFTESYAVPIRDQDRPEDDPAEE